MEQAHQQSPEALPAGLTPLAGEPEAAAASVGTGQGELAGTDNLEAKQYKTLGIRVDNELHAKLSFISQLRDSTLQGEIVQAVRDRVEAAQTDPELIEKATEVREQIEREARARQEAIAGMFGSVGVAAAGIAIEDPKKAHGRRGGRNTSR